MNIYRTGRFVGSIFKLLDTDYSDTCEEYILVYGVTNQLCLKNLKTNVEHWMGALSASFGGSLIKDMVDSNEHLYGRSPKIQVIKARFRGNLTEDQIAEVFGEGLYHVEKASEGGEG